MNIITGGVTAPKGFKAAGIHCGVKDNFTTPVPDKKDLAMVLSDVPCAAAGTYTRNVVKADPVILTKEYLADHKAQGIILDSGNANACAPKGMENAKRMAAAAAAPAASGIQRRAGRFFLSDTRTCRITSACSRSGMGGTSSSAVCCACHSFKSARQCAHCARWACSRASPCASSAPSRWALSRDKYSSHCIAAASFHRYDALHGQKFPAHASFFRSASRARASLDLTVPSGTPSSSAICA